MRVGTRNRRGLGGVTRADGEIEMGCRALMIAMAVAVAGCGPASPQSAPTADTATAASPKPLTLETASCAVETAAELPGEDVIREARATEPDAYGPTDLRVLLEGNAAGAAESASASPDDDLAALNAHQWRDLIDALEADPAEHVDAPTSDQFQFEAEGMQVRAVRIADVWFLSSETHAMPDSYCEDGDPEVSAAEALGLQCSGDLTEAGQLDYEAGAPGIGDDPLEVAQAWVDANVLQPSQVTLAPFEDEAGPVGQDIAVSRAGRTIVVLDIFNADGGGLLVGAFTACPTELAGGS